VNQDAERNPATAHMFIINPLSGQRMDNLFSTHPDTANRIAALKQMALEMGGGDGGFVAAAPQAGIDRTRSGPWGRGDGPSGGGRKRGPWG